MKRENIVPISVVCQQVHSARCKTFNLSLSTNASKPFCLLSFDSLGEDLIFDVFLEKDRKSIHFLFLFFSHLKYYFLINSFHNRLINQFKATHIDPSEAMHCAEYHYRHPHGLDRARDHFQSTLGRCLSLPLSLSLLHFVNDVSRLLSKLLFFSPYY